MVIQTRRMTVEEFDEFANLPENADKLFEFIGGEIVEVPSNPYASHLSSRINRRVGNFVEEHDLGYVTGEAGGYMVSGERYAPDVAFISKAKQPEFARQGYNPMPPDLAVEVDFPSTYESQQNLSIKVANYLAAGTVVWVFKPESRRVEVFAPGQPVRILGIDDVLDGGDVLPGFTLAIKDVFSTKNKRDASLRPFGLSDQMVVLRLLSRASFRHHDPEDDVEQDAGTAEHGEQHKCQTHERRIDIKVLGETTADAAEHAVADRTGKPFGLHRLNSLIWLQSDY